MLTHCGIRLPNIAARLLSMHEHVLACVYVWMCVGVRVEKDLLATLPFTIKYYFYRDICRACARAFTNPMKFTFSCVGAYRVWYRCVLLLKSHDI